jgi:flagellar hook protein FlgE
MSGVSGVKGHQVSLDVVGNNIANVNTAGYKRSSLTFQDLLYQTASGAMKPTDERGGINAQQIGLGVQVGAIEVLHTQGNTQFTGSRTDMAIQGDGYFVVVDGNNKLYTRAGNFILDASSNLVQAGTGLKVQGYAMERDPVDPTSFTQGSQLVDINIPVGDKMEARATEVAGFRCNLDSRVDTYLPMGILSNDVRINFSLDGDDYSLNVGTTSVIGNFMTLMDTNTPSLGNVVFSFAGIDDSSSLPILTVATTIAGATATYDSTTGQLTLTTGTDSQVIDITEYMHFSIFTDTSGANPVHYLAEFDENPASEGDRLLRLWSYVPATTTAAVLPALSIPMNSDGTFNLSDTQIVAGPPELRAETTENGLGLKITNATTGVLLTTLNQTLASVHSTKIDVYDSLGNPYTLEVSWEKIDNNQWRWRAWLPNDAGITLTGNTGILEFTADGKLQGTGTADLLLNFSARGALDATIKLDFSGETFDKDLMEGVTQYGVAYTTKGYYQDGYSMGVMTDFATGKDGTVTGVYNNGVNVPLYRVALALFANSAGLTKEGNTVFSESNNSGMAQIGAAMTGGAGEIAGSSLEMSNVDLTDEFTKLITSQRGFQANARMITTSDQVLEELINLKR